jgi:hypothetical protein
MRFDPANPKLTIGALDPNDYEGTINWVEMSQHPDPNGDYYNTFSVDGVKGYNGTFLPFGGNLTAALDSCEFSCTNGTRLVVSVNHGLILPCIHPPSLHIHRCPKRRDLLYQFKLHGPRPIAHRPGPKPGNIRIQLYLQLLHTRDSFVAVSTATSIRRFGGIDQRGRLSNRLYQ